MAYISDSALLNAAPSMLTQSQTIGGRGEGEDSSSQISESDVDLFDSSPQNFRGHSAHAISGIHASTCFVEFIEAFDKVNYYK
jgi:hypothetical protein